MSSSGGFGDLAQAVNYLTSHDVEKEDEARLMNFLLGPMLRDAGLGSGSVADVRRAVDEDGSDARSRASSGGRSSGCAAPSRC